MALINISHDANSYISIERVIQYTEIFKKTFMEAFLKKLKEIQSTATGKVQDIEVQYSTTGFAIKSILTNVLSKATEAVPLIGPFAAEVIQTLPVLVFERMKANNILLNEKEKNNKIAELGASYIESVIEEVGHEIIRIFEFQISALETPTDCEKLAKYAVEKIFTSGAGLNRGTSNSTPSFERDVLLSALLKEEKIDILDKIISAISKYDVLKANYYSHDDNGTKVHDWKISDVFVKVGLRGYVSLKKGIYEPICGFRASVFKWDIEKKTFIDSELDSSYITDVPMKLNNELYTYVSHYTLVCQEDIN